MESTLVKEERASLIAAKNDSFRTGGLMVMMTVGVRGMNDVAGLLRAVREFSQFSEDNDPHKEHDFGQLTWEGQKVFWKIDYYDGSFERWCDPLSSFCHRVMTVMLADEY